MYEKYEPCFKVLTARSLARSFRFPEWLLQSDDGESGGGDPQAKNSVCKFGDGKAAK